MIGNNFSFQNLINKDNIEIVLIILRLFHAREKSNIWKSYIIPQRTAECESIDSYVTELRGLRSTCDFGQLSESLIKNRIILGVKDQIIKDHLLRIKIWIWLGSRGLQSIPSHNLQDFATTAINILRVLHTQDAVKNRSTV